MTPKEKAFDWWALKKNVKRSQTIVINETIDIAIQETKKELIKWIKSDEFHINIKESSSDEIKDYLIKQLEKEVKEK